MATNYDEASSDYPSREDVYKDEQRQQRNNSYNNSKQNRIDEYSKNHPSASYAECEYYSRNK